MIMVLLKQFASVSGGMSMSDSAAKTISAHFFEVQLVGGILYVIC